MPKPYHMCSAEKKKLCRINWEHVFIYPDGGWWTRCFCLVDPKTVMHRDLNSGAIQCLCESWVFWVFLFILMCMCVYVCAWLFCGVSSQVCFSLCPHLVNIPQSLLTWSSRGMDLCRGESKTESFAASWWMVKLTVSTDNPNHPC